MIKILVGLGIKLEKDMLYGLNAKYVGILYNITGVNGLIKNT
jgi:hypothetical protein